MNREDVVIKFIKGKKVLDVGSVGQSDEYCLWSNIITKHAMYAKGVDLPESINILKEKFSVKEKGYEHVKDSRIILGNMETINLHEYFDVVTAGDVIEHVSNQGLFLDNIKKHMKKDGKLIITTPNAKWFTVFLKPNVTHTLWHDIYTLKSLLERHGFFIEYWKYYCGNKERYNFFKKIIVMRQQILVVARIN